MKTNAIDAGARDASSILAEAATSLQAVIAIAGAVNEASAAVTRVLRAGGHVFFCGNGGSSADAQHLAGEFLGKFLRERDAWASTALSANIAAITAIGNDYGYEDVFARQLRGLGRAGDVLFGISTSGRSPNVLKALQVARDMRIHAIGLTGAAAGPMDEIAHLTIHAPAQSTPRIQEMHIVVGHAICEIVESALISAG